MGRRTWAIGLGLWLVAGCGGGGSDGGSYRNLVQGAAQKGPLLAGSRVTIEEVDLDLQPTGRAFEAVADELGNFSAEVETRSGLVEVVAEGYYFDEASGRVSSTPVTLRALTDVTAAGPAGTNVNVLTHLARDRTAALVQAGKPFGEAKTQAEQEVGTVFRVAGRASGAFESLDLSGTGSDDAYLLAVSATLMEAAATKAGSADAASDALPDLLSSLSADLEDDGTVGDIALSNAFEEAYLTLDVDRVADHMGSRYPGFDASALAASVNRAPVAHAGGSGAACVGEAVLLSAAASRDADGDPLSYAWSLVSAPEGSAAALSGADGVSSSFTPDLPGEYVVTLVVGDGDATESAGVRTVAGDCTGGLGALRVVDVAAAAGPEMTFPAFETTDDSGADGKPGTGDFGEGDRRPTAGEVVLVPALSEDLLITVSCDGCENTVLERAVLSYRDGKGNERSFAPPVSLFPGIPVSPAPRLMPLLGLPSLVKTVPGGLRDIFLGARSADGLYASPVEELEAASTWTLTLDLYGRDTVGGRLYRGTASAEFHVVNPMLAGAEWVPDYGPLAIEADTANRKARISWPPVEGAASYRLHWVSEGHGWDADVPPVGVEFVAGTEYLLDLPRFTDYLFSLAAVRSDGVVAPPSFAQSMTSFNHLIHYPAGATCVQCHNVDSAGVPPPDGIVTLLRGPKEVSTPSYDPSGRAVTLSWTPVWTGSFLSQSTPWPWPIQYRVYSSTSPGVSKDSAVLGATGTTYFTHPGVESGRTYYYRVMAVSETGQWSHLSPEVSITVP